MKKITILLFLLLVTSCQKDENLIINSIDLNIVKETDWQMADEILVLINDYRNSLGLTNIIVDKQYASAYAVDHTKYMIENKELNHDNFNTRSEALKERGAKSVGENVAFGYKTAEAVVSAWITSGVHRDIIEGNFTHAGFGIILSPDGLYYTNIFYN